MAHASDLIATDIEQYLKRHEQKQLLRFITCGSVDDGKSTLIGRLLYESKLLFEDHLAAVERDSRKWGTQGDQIDFALLVDGLAAEREQGITIDVAYRFFSTDTRKFIVADTPGHEQYTRNMVTGASTSDCAVLMVDALKGVLVQTRRHSYLVNLLGIRHVLVAVNKMDLVGYSQSIFDDIAREYRRLAEKLAFDTVTFVPMSAFKGDNVVDASVNMPWWQGTTLMRWLETVAVDDDRRRRAPLRFPVQWVNRPNPDFRGFTGTIASGSVSCGDRIRIQPSGCGTTVARIVTRDGDLETAVAGQSITLVFAEEVDVSRGDMICAASAPCEEADQFECSVVWMDDEPLLPGRSYLMKIGAITASATVTEITHEVNVNTFEKSPATQLVLNAIAVCKISVDRAISFDTYSRNRETGGFILIDRLSNRTSGAGMIGAALRKATDIFRYAFDVDKTLRAAMKHQTPGVVWLTGLSGSGKSTIANLVERKLAAMGLHTYLLDGDNVRHGLNRDLGFSPEDRVENHRRVAEVAKLMVDAGLIVIASFISPFRSEREAAKAMFDAGEFFEIHIDAPVDLCAERDPKGLYARSRAGALKGLTGIDAPYEVPMAPELRINTAEVGPEDAAAQVVSLLTRR
jgi:bifunctional enzyme CysN/CysC